MQNRSKILALSLMVTALAACSSMQEKPSYATASSAVATSGTAVDENYVSTVEYLARQRGVEVRWVNMPTKHVAENQ